MTNEIVVKETGEIISPPAFTQEQIQLLKRTVCKDATDDEFSVFLNICKKVQLDPFSKQIYAIKYKGQMTTQTSIDGLRLIADRTGHYAPGKAPTFTYDKEGNLESATAYVMKKVGDQWFEVGSTAVMAEYKNNFNQLWAKLPHAMLSKCAESNALRRAFPNETSGIYSREEMDQAEPSKPSIKMPEPIKQLPEEKKEFTPLEEVAEVVQTDDIDFGDCPDVLKVKKVFGKKITEKQRKYLWVMWTRSIGDDGKPRSEDELRKLIFDQWGLDSTGDLDKDQLDQLLKICGVQK